MDDDAPQGLLCTPLQPAGSLVLTRDDHRCPHAVTWPDGTLSRCNHRRGHDGNHYNHRARLSWAPSTKDPDHA